MDRSSAQPDAKACPPELVELLERGMRGDPDCLPQLRRALDEHPELVEQFGDIVMHIQHALVALVTPNLVGREAITRKAAAVRAALRATAMTAVEQLLADRVAVCWLDVHACDLELAHRLKGQPGDTPAVRAAERRLNQSQARYLAATKALATAQKLLRPAPLVLELLGGRSGDARPQGAAGRRASFDPTHQGEPVAN
jgi:hypothetical protein